MQLFLQLISIKNRYTKLRLYFKCYKKEYWFQSCFNICYMCTTFIKIIQYHDIINNLSTVILIKIVINLSVKSTVGSVSETGVQSVNTGVMQV